MPKLPGEVIAIPVKTNAEKARTAAIIGQSLEETGLLSHEDAAKVAAEELLHSTTHAGGGEMGITYDPDEKKAGGFYRFTGTEEERLRVLKEPSKHGLGLEPEDAGEIKKIEARK